MAQTRDSASLPQVDTHLSGIREAFERLTEELEAMRMERNWYKAQLDAKAKEFDHFRQCISLRIVPRPRCIGLIGGRDVVPVQHEGHPATEYYFSQGEIRRNENPDSELQRGCDDIGSLPSTASTCTAGGASEEGKRNGHHWYAEFNSNVRKALDIKSVYTFVHEVPVFCVRFSADGMCLATGCEEGAATIYDTKTGAIVCLLVDRYPRQQLDLYAVCFSPEGRYLATAGADKKIRIWDIHKKHVRKMFKGHQGSIYSLDFSPDGRVVASCSHDSDTVRVWNMRTGSSRIFEGSNSYVWSVRFSPCGQYITAGSFGQVLVWDVRTKDLVKYSDEHTGCLNGLTFTLDGKRLVSGSSHGTLKLWNFSPLGSAQQQDGTTYRNEEIECLLDFVDSGYIRSVAVSYDSQWIISGSDPTVCIWNAHNAEQQCRLRGHKNDVYSVDFSPRGNYLATGSWDQHVTLWSYQTVEDCHM